MRAVKCMYSLLSLAPFIFLAPSQGHAELSASTMLLAKKCAPDISPFTMGYIVGHESENNRFAIGINSKTVKLPAKPTNEGEAKAIFADLMSRKISFDAGLGQINSANIRAYGMSPEQVFNGCENLKMAQRILKDCYAAAVKKYPAGQAALRHALSCYNTGSLTAGITNGYVEKVIAQIPQSNSLKVPKLVRDGEQEEQSQPDESRMNTDIGPAASQQAVNSSEIDVFSQSVPDAFGVSSDSDAFLTKRVKPEQP